MLEIAGVSKSFKGKTVLSNVNIDIGERGLIAVLGESGSGKSTLFNILTGAVKPDCGKVLYNGCELNTRGGINGKNVFGVIFQDGNLFGGLTVRQNLDLVCTDKRRQDEILERLKMSKFAQTSVAKLSGGETQRIAIARALLDESRILLADEPTGSLDERNGENVMALLKEVSAVKPVLLITHNTYFAQKYADRIISISGGVVEGGGAEIAAVKEDVPDAPARRMPRSCIAAFCAAKLKNTLLKNITSMLLLGLICAIISVALGFLTFDETSAYFQNAAQYDYFAIYDREHYSIAQFKEDMAKEDTSALTRFYHLRWDYADYLIPDDTLGEGEIGLGAACADEINEALKELSKQEGEEFSPIAAGDEISYLGGDYTVKYIAERMNMPSEFPLDKAVYLKEEEAARAIEAKGFSSMVAQCGIARIEPSDIAADASLSIGECSMNYALYNTLEMSDNDFDVSDPLTVTLHSTSFSAILYSSDFTVKIDYSSDEWQNPATRTPVLYVSEEDYEQILAACAYTGWYSPADIDAMEYWDGRGYRVFSGSFNDYYKGVSFKEIIRPYAAGFLAAGIALGALYLFAVLGHILAVNRREIYILKTLRAADGGLFRLLFLQVLPIAAVSYAIACAFAGASYAAVLRFCPFLQAGLAAAMLVPLAVLAAAITLTVALRIKRLNRRFDINLTR